MARGRKVHAAQSHAAWALRQHRQLRKFVLQQRGGVSFTQLHLRRINCEYTSKRFYILAATTEAAAEPVAALQPARHRL
jgi:hypothetical protein